MAYPEEVIARFNEMFFRYVVLEDECWIWRGGRCSSRYPHHYAMIHYKRKQWMAHKISYEVYKEPIPDGVKVLHSCDKPRCVNPEHLFLGSQMDNVRDMILKGRSNFHGCTKLAPEDVIEIRRRCIRTSPHKSNMKQLAEEFNISLVQVYRIVTNSRWKNLQLPESTTAEIAPA